MNGDDCATRKYWPWIAWTYRRVETYSCAMIRFFTGAILATHGVARLFGPAPAFGLTKYVAALPPASLGAFELAGGLALAAGFLTRPVALLFTVLWLLFSFSHAPGGPESWFMLGAFDHYPAMLACLCIAFVFRGGGRWSLDHRIGREF